LTSREVAQGIVFPQDFLNKKNQTVLGHNLHVGQGVFALSQSEKKAMYLDNSEQSLIKPLYTTDQIERYYSNPNNSVWAIYTDSRFKDPNSMDKYPNLKAHLDRFRDIITSDNKPYGLHRAREERFFKGEKVIALRKCVGRPLFSYSDFDCYLSATFYVIKTSRVNMKYLTGLLNSKLVKFWLKNRGKMQGNNFQLDKEPLLEIPIYKPSVENQLLVARIVDYIIFLKSQQEPINQYVDNTHICQVLEDVIDAMIYELYFEENFSNINISFIQNAQKQFLDICNFSEIEKIKIVHSVYQNLREPLNEIRNNLKLVSIELRDLLMPIMTV
jgi:hypothetical protein